MDEKQINDASKHFKMIYRHTDEYEKDVTNNTDKNNKFYSYFYDLYCYDLQREGYKIDYPPLNKFYEISKQKCIEDSQIEYFNLINFGVLSKHSNLDFLEFSNNFSFYKTMDGFYTIEDEKKYIDKNRNIPFWFSSPYLAYLAINARHGGITAYKTNRKINILVINCDNIKQIIQLVKQKENDKIYIRDQQINKEYALDLLRLSACSEKGFIDQLSIFAGFNKYGNELWLTKEAMKNDITKPCNLKVDTNDYFGITKQKGKHNYNFAYLLSYLNKKHWSNKFDGYVILNKYTPYFYSGVTLEEFVLFDAYGVLSRNPKDKYDWYSYKDYLDFKIPTKFKLPYLFSEYNNDFKLFRTYSMDYKSKHNMELKNLANKNKSIIYLDVNYFNSLNTFDNKNITTNYLNNFVAFMDADIYLLLNAPNYLIKGYNNITKDNISFYYKNKEDKDKYKVLFLNLPQKKHSYLRPFFKDFIVTAEANYNNNIKNIQTALEHNPDTIFIKCKLTESSPEFKYLVDKGYQTSKLTTTIYPNNLDYIFTKSKYIKIDTLDYAMSYFFPIIIISEKN